MANELYELASNAKWVHEASAEVRIKQISGHTDSVNSCQLIRNDEILLTASNDNTVRLWDFTNGRQLKVYSDLHSSVIPKATVNHDYSKFITCSWDRSVKCWDLETGKLLYFKNDSKYVVSVSDVDLLVKIWDINTGELVSKIPDLHKSTITSCQFTPKNDRIVTTSMDKSCKFFDIIANKSTITLGSHTGVISNSCFTPDERRFATCSWDKTIQIWDIPTGMYRKNGPMTLQKGHEGSISSCYISQDGMLCVSGGYDARIVLWDMVHRTPKLMLRGHTNWINDVAITGDNKWIVSVGKDKEIRQWDIENCENIKLVIEQNKNLGNKLINCSICGRPFTINKLQKKDEVKMYCVFCRLLERTEDELFSPKANSTIHSQIHSQRHSRLNFYSNSVSQLQDREVNHNHANNNHDHESHLSLDNH